MATKTTSCVIAIVVACSLLIGVNGAAPSKAEERTVRDGCGQLEWVLSGNELVISGTGDMCNYSSASETPWYGDRSKIYYVIIKDGVTSIGSYAFYYFPTKSVSISSQCDVYWKERFSVN